MKVVFELLRGQSDATVLLVGVNLSNPLGLCIHTAMAYKEPAQPWQIATGTAVAHYRLACDPFRLGRLPRSISSSCQLGTSCQPTCAQISGGCSEMALMFATTL